MYWLYVQVRDNNLNKWWNKQNTRECLCPMFHLCFSAEFECVIRTNYVSNYVKDNVLKYIDEVSTMLDQ